MKRIAPKLEQLHREADELLSAADPDSGPAWAEWKGRAERVLDRLEDTLNACRPLLSDAEWSAVRAAVDDGKPGPLLRWVDDVLRGRSRVPPDLTQETTAALVRAWLSPDTDERSSEVCEACGLQLPRHVHPPMDQWKVLPGKTPLVGSPPWYDLPEHFKACPHCGAKGWMWDHRILERSYPWMDRDGYVGPPPSPAGVED